MASTATNKVHHRIRGRDLGLPFKGRPGRNNNITDVAGVSVGYVTKISGEGPLSMGFGPVRTGVTAILPRPMAEITQPVFAHYFNFNGNGEMSGAHYLDEVGQMSLPITITNTNACGVTRDATLKWLTKTFPEALKDSFSLPIAAETYDGFLNDINGFHVHEDDVFHAIENAKQGVIEEGSVGGGTGMKCFDFKAGSGSASRLVDYGSKQYTIGVFVQANFGDRENLTILGHNLGKELQEPQLGVKSTVADLSSIIAIIATDAPLMPHQLRRLAKRASLGMGRLGTIGNHSSGDLFLAFSTANKHAMGASKPQVQSCDFIPDQHLDKLFGAVVEGVEEAIINSMVANTGMTGRDGNFVPALPHACLKELAENF